jgi:hypothetical protein
MGVQTTDPITGKPTFNDVSTTQADFQALADWADPSTKATAATYSALPSTGYPGQRIRVTSDPTAWRNGDYVWLTGPGWTPVLPKLSHVEYTTNVVGLTDGNGFSAHNYAADAANTTDSTLVSVATPDVTLRDAGVYAVSWAIAMSVVSTSAASVLAISLNGTQIAAVTIGTTSSATITIPNLYVPAAAAKLRFTVNKFSGGGCDVNGRLRITKIGG